MKKQSLLPSIIMAGFLFIGQPVSCPAQAQGNAPTAPLSEGWQQLAGTVKPVAATVWNADYPSTHWWEGFNDPQLTAWVEKALISNPSLAAVEARIQEAEGLKLVASSRLKPQAQVGTSYTWQYYSKSQFPFALNQRIYQLFSTPLQASYEIDWLGQARNQRQIATKGVDASKLQYQAARSALASAVVNTYVQWATLESLLTLHQQYVAGLKTLKGHAQQLVAEGQQPVTTLRDAEAALAQGNTQLAMDEALRAEAKHQLAVLLGQTPAQFQAQLEANAIEAPALANLTVWESLPTGLPASLLDHRPDIQRAEVALEAANIQIKVAKKNFLPRIMLNGQAGFTSLYAHRWLTLDALSSAITPSITLPLTTGGANKGRLKIAKSQREQALNQYLDTVNAACGEVETALARLRASHVAFLQTTQRQTAVLDKVNLIQGRYQAGLDSEPVYWLAALEAVPAQSDAIMERAQVALDTANLMTALGGGFEAPKEP